MRKIKKGDRVVVMHPPDDPLVFFDKTLIGHNGKRGTVCRAWKGDTKVPVLLDGEEPRVWINVGSLQHLSLLDKIAEELK